jgi:uridine kinase
MLGDVLLIQEKHQKAAQIITEYFLPLHTAKNIIAIAGESGSGKSELSHCIGRLLVKEYNIPTKIIHSDNYYKIHPHQRTEWRKKHGFKSVGLNEIDWDTLNQNIQQFKAGQQAEMPCIDIIPDEPDILITDFSKIDVLIIDGLYALQSTNIDLGIYINLTYHETKKAQTDRGKEPNNDFRWGVLEQEHQMVTQLKKKAKIIIEKDYSVSIL